MRGLPILLVAVVPVLSGCNLVKLASFNAVNEPHLYQDQQHLKKRAAEFAQQAWQERVSHMNGECPPKPFECGYLEGFADYLFKGGGGAPPAVPPPQLRRYQYLSPDGHNEMEEYYSGFTAGATDAKASGQRVYFTVPISSGLPTRDKLLEQATETIEPILETLPKPKEAVDDDLGRAVPQLPPAVVVAPLPSADVPPAPRLSAVAPLPPPLPAIAPPVPTMPVTTPQLPDTGPAHPELLQPPPKAIQLTEPVPVGPANTIRDRTEQPLPREFTLPILGGAGSR